MKIVPDDGNGLPALIWLFANARPNERSMPMTSPVERISGPSTVSTPGKRLNGSTASFTLVWPDAVGGRKQTLFAQLGERRADHHPGRDLRERHAGRLGDERHRAARPRVRLEHEHLPGLHRVLDVDEAPDVERARDRPRVAARSPRSRSRSAKAAAARTRSRRSGRRPPRRAPSRRRSAPRRSRRGSRRHRPRRRPRGTGR